MRTHLKVATLSLVLAAGACARREEPAATLSDDLKRDLAAASAASGDLAVAPQSYQRMRFVSDVEQPRKVERVKRPSAARRPPRPTVARSPAPETEPTREPEALAAAEAPAPAPVPESEAAMPEPVVIAQRPTPDPLPADVIPVSEPSGGGMGERGRRGGIGGSGVGGMGGILGGILGGVVIRGGHGGRDKCDPRTDGRTRPPVYDRPTFGMPMPTGQTFPMGRGR
jgi:hypothetical protein